MVCTIHLKYYGISIVCHTLNDWAIVHIFGAPTGRGMDSVAIVHHFSDRPVTLTLNWQCCVQVLTAVEKVIQG